MKSYLNIEVNGNNLRLPENCDINGQLQNPLFNRTEELVIPFQLPMEGNRRFSEVVDSVDTKKRLHELEDGEAKLFVEGVQLMKGIVNTEDGTEISENFAFNIEQSNKNLYDRIAGLKCSDIPLIDDILIGEMIGEVKINATITTTVTPQTWGSGTQNHGSSGERTNTYTLSGEFTPQALGFSYPAKCVVGNNQQAVTKEIRDYKDGKKVIVPEIYTDYINVTDAYPTKKYCNARVCYKHYDKSANTDYDQAETIDSIVPSGSSTGNYEDIWPYWVLDAHRPQSGICFYVLYFLDCLFAHLNICWDNTELLKVEDLKHLAFFTTACKYTTTRLHGSENNPYFTDLYTPPQKTKKEVRQGTENSDTHLPNINAWLSSRGCGGYLDVSLDQFGFGGQFGSQSSDDDDWKNPSWRLQESYTVTANILSMHATKENFPKESVETLLESLESAFGIRFLYNEQTNVCKAVLMRDIYNTVQPRKVHGKVSSCHPVNEKIKGVRVCYSKESKKKEQLAFITEGKKDYDTTYDYTDFRSANTKLGANVTYDKIFNNVSPTDENVYVDLNTGNAYRIKIDANAVTENERKPVIFQVAHLHGVEIGDCSEKQEDFVHEISIGFEPVTMTDVNYRNELIAQNPQAINAAFIDEDMEHEFVTQKIVNSFSAIERRFDHEHTPYKVDCSLVEVLNLIENYNPTKTDDGNSPLQHIDWGLAVALMRGGGSDATVQNFDEDYDGFGNSRWATTAGLYQMDIDTMDCFGNQYDYNGDTPGLGSGERFSLKIQGYRNFRYKYVSDVLVVSTDPTEWEQGSGWLIPCVNDIYSSGQLITKIKTRGLYDSFLLSHAQFLLNHKRLRYSMLTTTAQILTIKEHWTDWWEIDGKIGLVDNIQFSANTQKGLEKVTIDLLTP